MIRAKVVGEREVDAGNDIYGNPIKRIQYEVKQIKVGEQDYQEVELPGRATVWSHHEGGSTLPLTVTDLLMAETLLPDVQGAQPGHRGCLHRTCVRSLRGHPGCHRQEGVPNLRYGPTPTPPPPSSAPIYSSAKL